MSESLGVEGDVLGVSSSAEGVAAVRGLGEQGLAVEGSHESRPLDRTQGRDFVGSQSAHEFMKVCV